MKFQFIVLIAAGLAVILGCIETTSVEAPVEVDPNTTFQAIVHTEVVDTNAVADSSFTGLLSVLIPCEWSVDSVFVTGYGYSGPMSHGDFGWDVEDWCPPASGYQWVGFHTPTQLIGWLGDTGQATVFITTGNTLGSYWTAFLGGAFYGGGSSPGFFFEGDPCSCAVEVTPLNLDQETWGHIKSEF